MVPSKRNESILRERTSPTNPILYGTEGIGAGAPEVAEHSERKRFDEIFSVDQENNLHCDKHVEQIGDVFETYSPSKSVFSICVGEPTYRKALWDKVVSRGFSVFSLIHPNMEIPDNCHIDEGLSTKLIHWAQLHHRKRSIAN